MPQKHPNKQKAMKALSKSDRKRRRRAERRPLVVPLPPKPITSTTWRKDRSSRLARMPDGFVDPHGWGSKHLTTYTTASRWGVYIWRPLRCLCEACERRRGRAFKARPAKDVEAARLQTFRKLRNQHLESD